MAKKTLHRLVDIFNYEYDDEGNRTKKTTISGGAYETYEWDHRNRLTKVTFKNSSHTVLKTVEHQYDILNRWTRRHTDPDGPGGASARDNFFAYDGIQPIYQFDGAADTDLIDRYLWGTAVDQILADEQVTSLGSAGNIIHPLTDHLGTSRDLADQNESTHTTTVTNHRIFNSFGKLTAETNSAVDCDPAYTGKITDSDTNLQYNINRWYDAVLGQWASEDPIGFLAGDPNIRRMVGNLVTSLTDPLGLEELFIGARPTTPEEDIIDSKRLWLYNFARANPDLFDGCHDEAYELSDEQVIWAFNRLQFSLDMQETELLIARIDAALTLLALLLRARAVRVGRSLPTPVIVPPYTPPRPIIVYVQPNRGRGAGNTPNVNISIPASSPPTPSQVRLGPQSNVAPGKPIVNSDQSKHVPGRNDYNATKGRSVFTHPDAQGLLNKGAGTGTPIIES